jgi:hypothetical protein
MSIQGKREAWLYNTPLLHTVESPPYVLRLTYKLNELRVNIFTNLRVELSCADLALRALTLSGVGSQVDLQARSTVESPPDQSNQTSCSLLLSAHSAGKNQY